MNPTSKDCIILADKAKQQYDKGRSLHDQNKYDEAIAELQESLKVRILLYGRYHKKVSLLYKFIGDCYLKRDDSYNAIATYRTWQRIERYLSEPDAENAIEDSVMQSLKNCGLMENQIKLYISNLDESLQCEKDGDIERSKGNFKEAVKTYHKAIFMEKDFCNYIGIDIISLNFLWRKVALIDGRINNSYMGLRMNWDRLDRMEVKKEQVYGIADDVVEYIKNGDDQFVNGNYREALEIYQKASDFVREKEIVESCEQKQVESNLTLTEQVRLQDIKKQVGSLQNSVNEIKSGLKRRHEMIF